MTDGFLFKIVLCCIRIAFKAKKNDNNQSPAMIDTDVLITCAAPDFSNR